MQQQHQDNLQSSMKEVLEKYEQIEQNRNEVEFVYT